MSPSACLCPLLYTASTRPAQCLLPQQTATLSPFVPHSPVYSGKEKSQRLSNPHVSFVRASTPPFPNICDCSLQELSRLGTAFMPFEILWSAHRSFCQTMRQTMQPHLPLRHPQ